jgi:hypothetical protein
LANVSNKTRENDTEQINFSYFVMLSQVNVWRLFAINRMENIMRNLSVTYDMGRIEIIRAQHQESS